MRRKPKTKLKNRIFLFLLVYITFLTFCMMANTLSKYVGENKKSGDVTISNWDIELLSVAEDVEIVAGNTTYDYELKISNNSETSLTYDIVITGLPNNVEVALDNATSMQATTGDIVFHDTNNLRLNANDRGLKTHILTFSALPDGQETISNVKIYLTFTQELPN